MSLLQECLDYRSIPLAWFHIFVRFQRNSGQMAICGAYEHPQAQAGPQALSTSRIPLMVSTLANWLFSVFLTLLPTVNYFSSWASLPLLSISYSPAISATSSLGPLFCCPSLLAPLFLPLWSPLLPLSSLSFTAYPLSPHG